MHNWSQVVGDDAVGVDEDDPEVVGQEEDVELFEAAAVVAVVNVRLEAREGSAKFSGQSYKHFMLVNYDSRVVITSKLLILTTLET